MFISRSTEDEPEMMIRGKHEAIVNEELFDRVQMRFQSQSRKGELKIRGYHPQFYLRGFL